MVDVMTILAPIQCHSSSDAFTQALCLRCLRNAGRARRRRAQRRAGHIDRRAAEIGDVAAGEADIVVFYLQRPGGRQRLFDAEADSPAPECGVGAVRRDAGPAKPARSLLIAISIWLLARATPALP